VTPVTRSRLCGYLSPLSPLAHLYVCLRRKTVQKTRWGYKRRFTCDSATGDSGDSGDADFLSSIYLPTISPCTTADAASAQRGFPSSQIPAMHRAPELPFTRYVMI
jgi:hypothetical protein